nr:hypothetical protein CFP56_03313 [Quercus suber]
MTGSLLFFLVDGASSAYHWIWAGLRATELSALRRSGLPGCSRSTTSDLDVFPVVQIGLSVPKRRPCMHAPPRSDVSSQHDLNMTLKAIGLTRLATASRFFLIVHPASIPPLVQRADGPIPSWPGDGLRDRMGTASCHHPIHACPCGGTVRRLQEMCFMQSVAFRCVALCIQRALCEGHTMEVMSCGVQEGMRKTLGTSDDHVAGSVADGEKVIFMRYITDGPIPSWPGDGLRDRMGTASCHHPIHACPCGGTVRRLQEMCFMQSVAFRCVALCIQRALCEGHTMEVMSCGVQEGMRKTLGTSDDHVAGSVADGEKVIFMRYIYIEQRKNHCIEGLS